MPLVTLCTQTELLIAKKEPEIRPVGSMTRAALSFLNQGVLVKILFAFEMALAVLVATEAYPDIFCLSKVILIRGVRIVAVHAEHTLVDVAIYLHEVFLNGLVASQTRGYYFFL